MRVALYDATEREAPLIVEFDAEAAVREIKPEGCSPLAGITAIVLRLNRRLGGAVTPNQPMPHLVIDMGSLSSEASAPTGKMEATFTASGTPYEILKKWIDHLQQRLVEYAEAVATAKAERAAQSQRRSARSAKVQVKIPELIVDL